MTERALPPDLNQAGAVVDQAIAYLVRHDVDGLAIASALLAGALGLMARTMTTEAMVQVLQNAISSTRAGALDRGA